MLIQQRNNFVAHRTGNRIKNIYKVTFFIVYFNVIVCEIIVFVVIKEHITGYIPVVLVIIQSKFWFCTIGAAVWWSPTEKPVWPSGAASSTSSGSSP